MMNIWIYEYNKELTVNNEEVKKNKIIDPISSVINYTVFKINTFGLKG